MRRRDVRRDMRLADVVCSAAQPGKSPHLAQHALLAGRESPHTSTCQVQLTLDSSEGRFRSSAGPSEVPKRIDMLVI